MLNALRKGQDQFAANLHRWELRRRTNAHVVRRRRQTKLWSRMFWPN